MGSRKVSHGLRCRMEHAKVVATRGAATKFRSGARSTVAADLHIALQSQDRETVLAAHATGNLDPRGF